MARAFDAELTVLHVLEPSRSNGELVPSDAFEWELRRTEARCYLEATTRERATSDLRMHVELIEGRAAEQIRDWVSGHDVDLTALCSHGVSGRTEWSLASTAKKLIEAVRGSLLLIPAWSVQEPGKQEVRYERLVVPLDGSPRAESVLPLVDRLARHHGSEILLAHVVPVPQLTRVGPLTSDDVYLEQRLVERNERVATDYLTRLRARLSERHESVRTILAHDDEVRGGLLRIIEYERADLVVLSGHGSTGRTELPFGSVTGHLVEHGTTPLVIVRESLHRTRRPPIAKSREGTVRLPPQASP
jgi:nucleotide-binding universal stress UspA family protein